MISNEIRYTLQKVCSLLNKHQVDYLIVGGVAVGYHGFNRMSTITGRKPENKNDLDFWYNPTIEIFTKLIRALIELNVEKELLDQIVFDPLKTFLKIPHGHFHTDFLPHLTGLDNFKEAKKQADKVTLDGNELFIIGFDDLLKNNEAMNRNVDAIDIEKLKQEKNNPPQ
jgi:hypothetical protein